MTFEEWFDSLGLERGFENCIYDLARDAWNARAPEGYVLVPVEPTEAMISYMETGYLDPDPETPEDHVKHIYRMMLLGLQDEE